ncbi:MAG: response regulator [Pyrinomonadaceae bacterium]|nr:response regulator [Pyrinomonadaceae bacterium]
MEKVKLLLADDSVAIRKVIELTFAEEGYDVTTVGDGNSAMEKFVEISPDCVIADVNMPGMGGYQLCEMIKGDDSTRTIPVILVVGSFEAFDPGEASRVGADHYFTKPFQSLRDVVTKVGDLLAVRDFREVQPFETEDIENLYAESIVEDDPDIEVESEIAQEYSAAESTVPEPDDLIAESFPDREAEPEAPPVTSTEPPSSVTDLNFELGEITRQMDDEAPDVQTLVPHEPFVLAEDEPGTQDDTVPDVAPLVTGDDSVIRVYDFAAGDDELIDTLKFEKPAEPAAVAYATVEDPELQIGELDPFKDVAAAAPHVEEAPAPVKFELDDAVEDFAIEESTTSVSEMTFPPALIEAIAQRVMDRLSEKAVREAAREAVPRIAEKLIREALDEESKRH